ncbi:zinc finger protein 236 [Cyclopterus lumpus]|uniref:zinc finger protein 236 n=1 Tax=Cyclopterus lumpus TaxID=8103 RepID=UPI0014871C26|nr:zinc finger protein 236 [Cyclopterus lumpus]XP_034410029.1 zinc finger protein 236 [Cyclopterus lumpus]XP_034410030.1 zinc finger protein 236 [Cyclopterus lumpus]
MDSQLASVLTRGSLDVQNGSHRAEGSGPATEGFLDPKEETSRCTVPGSPEPCPDKEALTIRQSAPSINGNKPEVGGTSKPASQETRTIGVFRQPITVKTGVPVLRSQPIRLKIVVPPRCNRPITNSAISPTKDFAHSHFRRPVLVPAGAETNCKILISAVKNEEEVTYHTTEEAKPESIHEETMCKEKHVSGVQIIHTDGSETPLISSTNTVKILSLKGVKEETTEKHIEENIPLILKDMDFKSCLTFDEMGMEEQTEPLDLSLPKKRERRCERLLEDSGCESSLIMEVDEYEGEGDRDIVEEDNDTEGEVSVLRMDATDTLEDSLLSPAFFSTSVFTSLSSIDCDTSNLLLIDDEGIPYTLNPDGLKVPQVDASTSEDQGEAMGSPQLSTLADPSLSQSLDNALNAPCDHLYSSPAPAADSPSVSADRTKPPEVFTSLITNSEPPDVAEPSLETVLEANAVISIPTQPIQILTNPSSNTPILLLSSSSSSSSSSPQLSSAQVGLSLPLSVTQTSSGASNPMFLLLSPVPSFSGDSASTSTPIAVLDPSTGQLSQITAASAPVSLPLPPSQAGALGSPLPTLSHPVIRLSPNNAPDILSGVTNINSVLTSLTGCSSSPALQNDRRSARLHSQVSPSDSKPGSEAIAAEEVSRENNKPSTFTTSSPHSQSASLTVDPLAQPCAEAQSPVSEPRFEPSDLHSEHLPLDDHLYFSAAAPPSPPIGPILPSDNLDPLDPLSPEGSPNAMASRRVMYCQLCPRVFFYLSDLERHAITHSQKKPHVCQQCGKAFKRSSHLQRHKHIHTGQRNFVCPICAKRFREAGELQRHQRVHTGEKPYQCQLCHTRFAERNTLRRHTKRKHPYHQVAMEMLNERRDRGGGGGGGGVGSAVQDEEESAEWYSSTVSNLENSESEMET